MHIRLNEAIEQKLTYFANELETTKTNLIRPYILRMIEDMEDYMHARKALEEVGGVSLDELEKEFCDVEG